MPSTDDLRRIANTNFPDNQSGAIRAINTRNTIRFIADVIDDQVGDGNGGGGGSLPGPIENVPVDLDAIHSALVQLGLITPVPPTPGVTATDASGAVVVLLDAANQPVTIEE